MPMHVAINGMLLGPHPSGVEYAILNLARGLADYGTGQYTLYVPDPGMPGLPASDRLSVCRAHRPFHSRVTRIAWEQAVLPGRAERDGADILHAPGYIAPLLTRLPVVLTVYDTIALRFPEWSKRANTLHYRLLLPASLRKAAAILVPSETTRRDLCRVSPRSEPRIRVIPLGVSPSFFAAQAPDRVAALRERLALPPRFILFVGQQEPKKNLAGLLEAFALLKREGHVPHQLVIVGRRGWRTAPLQRAIQRLGLDDETRVTGFLPEHDMPLLYAAADLFVFPSLYEGFGLPPLEAMACGIPVVASDRGALAENLAGAACLVSPEDPPALSEAIRSVLGKRELYNALVQSGRERASGFSWQRTVRETERVYHDAAGRRS